MKAHIRRNRSLGRWAGLAMLVVLMVAALPGALPAFATYPPTMDGRVDDAYSHPTYGQEIPFLGLGGVPEAWLWVYDDPAYTNIWLAWEVTRDYVDNSYDDDSGNGDSLHPSWPKGHSFWDLVESDLQEIKLLNSCGEMVVHATMDYGDGFAGGGIEYLTPSGYDAIMDSLESIKVYINGDFDTDFEYTTSLMGNLNLFGYCSYPHDGNGEGTCNLGPNDLLGNHSPVFGAESPSWQTPPGYDWIPVSPYYDTYGWEYSIIYEMKVARTVFQTTPACPAGVIAPIATQPGVLHASPNKGEGSPGVDPAIGQVGDYVYCYESQGPPTEGINGIPLELWVKTSIDPDPPVWLFAGEATTAYNADAGQDGYYLFDRLPVGVDDDLDGVIADSEKRQYKVVVRTDDPSWPLDVGKDEQIQGGDDEAETTAGDHPDASGGLYYTATDEVLEDLTLDFEYICAPTGIDLLWFKARGWIRSVVLGWETASEVDNLGFNLYRTQRGAGGQWTKLNDELIPSQVPPGSPFGAVYRFWDTGVEAGIIYFYRLEEVDIYGRSTLHGPVMARGWFW